MYDEEKTINFTTQNAILHYGVKGMRWGVINEDQPLGRAVRGAYRSLPQGIQRVGSAANKGLKAVGRGAAKTGRFARQVYRDWDASMDEAIDAEVARKQAKARANATPEQKAKREEIEKMNRVSDDAREGARQTRDGYNRIEKYVNAYNEGISALSSDKQKKQFAERFWNNYGDKINSAIHDYNEGINRLSEQGYEGLDSDQMGINGKKPIDIMSNLTEQTNAHGSKIKKKTENIVKGDYMP